MSVRKRGNSYWIDFGFNKKRIRKKSPENSFKGAKAFEALIRQKLARGQPLEDPKPERKYTFKEFAPQWLEVDVKNNNKPSEYYNRKNILANTLIPYFGNKHIDNITTYDIEQYKSTLLNERDLSSKSVNNYLSILRKCLKSALESDIIKILPRIKPLKVSPQTFDFLSESETELLLNRSNGKWHDMIFLAVKTGLRFGELIALKWQDIDFNSQTLTVRRNIVHGIEGSPKNNKTRTVPLTQSVIEMLSQMDRDNPYVFHNDKGGPLHYTYCRKKLHRFCNLAGLRIINWHILRHTFASHLATKGVSVFAIKELLGHSDIKMTMRYVHPNLPMLKTAIEALEPELPFNGTIASQTTGRDNKSGLLLPLKLHNSLIKSKKLDEYEVE